VVDKFRLIFPILFATCFLLQTPAEASWFMRKLKGNAQQHFLEAQEMLDSGKSKSASRRFRGITNTWPESAEAAQSQLQIARIAYLRKNYTEAFEEYQFLIDRYAGRFDYEEVLERQYDIAKRVQRSNPNMLSWGKGNGANTKAIDLLKTLVMNGPRWEKAPEAHMRIGEIFEKNKSYEDAIRSYGETVEKYPDGEIAETASFRKADCMYRLAMTGAKDDLFIQEAWNTYDTLLQDYPDSDFGPKAFDKKQQIYTKLAKVYYDRAVYYDKRARKPKAALTAYSFFVENFPASPFVESSNARIAALKKIVPDEE